MQLHSFQKMQVWLAAVTCAVLVVTLLPGLALAVGSADAGRNLFTGQQRFANGGPACISCHGAGDAGSLGGGTLGPDLTKVMGDEAKAALVSSGWINNTSVGAGGNPNPMGAVYGGKRNVTDQEVENIQEFLKSVSNQAPVSQSGKFIGISVIGSIVLLIIFSIVWAGRYRSRNQGTAHDALWRNYGGKGGK